MTKAWRQEANAQIQFAMWCVWISVYCCHSVVWATILERVVFIMVHGLHSLNVYSQNGSITFPGLMKLHALCALSAHKMRTAMRVNIAKIWNCNRRIIGDGKQVRRDGIMMSNAKHLTPIQLHSLCLLYTLTMAHHVCFHFFSICTWQLNYQWILSIRFERVSARAHTHSLIHFKTMENVPSHQHKTNTSWKLLTSNIRTVLKGSLFFSRKCCVAMDTLHCPCHCITVLHCAYIILKYRFISDAVNWWQPHTHKHLHPETVTNTFVQYNMCHSLYNHVYSQKATAESFHYFNIIRL